MKKYLLPFALTLLLFMAACSNNVSKSVTKDQPLELVDTSYTTALIDTVSVGTLPVIDLIDTTGANFKLICHPNEPAGYRCRSLNCPCCFKCILPPIYPWEPPFPWDTLTVNLYAYQYKWVISIPDEEEFKPTGSLLIKLKVWQDVTGVMHYPIVKEVCCKAGYNFWADI